jgi:hypothetical protein
MAQYPPGPPGYPPAPPPAGGGYPPPPGGGGPGGYDPYAQDKALEAWAATKSYTLSNTPDLNWYLGWYPFQYVFRLARVGRELRATFGEATVHVIEGFEADQLKQAAGEDRYLFSFVLSPKLTLRAALRAKTGGGLVNEVSRGLGSLLGGSPGSVLGDPHLEGRYEVWAPSRDEGNRALPVPLRQHLFQLNFSGILETRPGGMVVVFFTSRTFDPNTLDSVINTTGQLYQLAVTSP